MATTSTQGAFGFAFANSLDGTPLLYDTVNTLTLQVTNNSGQPATLTGGTPSIDPAGSTFALLVPLAALFTNAADQGNLTVTPPAGWTATYFGSGDYPCWAISPNQDYAWSVGETLSFAFGNLTPTTSSSTVYIAIDAFNLPGNPFYIVSLPVGIGTPSQNASLFGVVSMSFTPNTIDVTRPNSACPANSITLTLTNLTTKPLNGGTSAWSTPPSFNLAFVYASEAPGYGALTTADAAQNIQVELANGTTGWTANQIAGQYGPTWQIQPEASNIEILGPATGVTGTASFTISGIQTGFLPSSTCAFIMYSGVPNYADGMLVGTLETQYGPMSVSLSACGYNGTGSPAGGVVVNVPPQGVTAGSPTAGTVGVQLDWTVENASLVTLSGVGQVGPTGTETLPIGQSTNFVLTGYDTCLNDILSVGAVVPVVDAATTSFATPLSALLSGSLPLGVIVPWTGAVDGVPAGFLVCDGKTYQSIQYPELYGVIGTTFGINGAETFMVPNLSDRFVMGVNTGYTLGQTGGTTGHTHALSSMPKVSGVVTSTNGSHTHAFPTNWYARSVSSSDHSWALGIDTDGTYDPGALFQSNGDHVHTVSIDCTNQQTESYTGSLRPNWFAFCYLIRCA